MLVPASQYSAVLRFADQMSTRNILASVNMISDKILLERLNLTLVSDDRSDP